MPREQINHPDLDEKERQRALRAHVGYDLAESQFGPWNESAVHVGWRGPATADTEDGTGWVQVGLEVDIDYAHMAIANPNGARKDRTVMYSPALSPVELDRLIDTLKRARRAQHNSTQTIVEDLREQALHDREVDGHLKALGLG